MSSPKSYLCLRAMTDNGRDYARGDEIELSDADAAGLLQIGAISDESATPDDSADLDAMKVEDLKALAEREQVSLEGATKKAEIIAAIRAKREAA